MHKTFWKTGTAWGKKPKQTKANPEDKAWKAFSEFIRLRDCLRTTGLPTVGRCVTSNVLIPAKGNDAGHFVSRVATAIKYDPRNCHLQSAKDNRFQQGAWDKYMDFMVSFYGQAVVDELMAARYAMAEKWPDWDEKAAYWRELRKRLADAYATGSLGKTQAQIMKSTEELMKSGKLYDLENWFAI